MKYKELTEKIIGYAYRVYNRMGYGFQVQLLILANGKLKSRAAQALAPRERKVKDFDEDLQDEF